MHFFSSSLNLSHDISFVAHYVCKLFLATAMLTSSHCNSLPSLTTGAILPPIHQCLAPSLHSTQLLAFPDTKSLYLSSSLTFKTSIADLTSLASYLLSTFSLPGSGLTYLHSPPSKHSHPTNLPLTIQSKHTKISLASYYGATK